ncbi:MAG: plasmid mobilization relaxosome protein MobC [Bacteroidales bacterium]
MSEKEYQRLEQMANNLGMTVPTFCKKKAQGARMKGPLIDREGALQIASELRRIGVNANQIAKHLNSEGKASEGQINALQKELNDIWQLLNLALQGAQAD